MPGGGANRTCRVFMTEEVGIIRNVMMTVRRVVLTVLWQWNVLLREHVYPTVSGTASQSEVGVDRGLGE